MANNVLCPLPTLRRLLGHRDIESTMRYIRPTDATGFVNQFADLVKSTERPATAGHKGP